MLMVLLELGFLSPLNLSHSLIGLKFRRKRANFMLIPLQMLNLQLGRLMLNHQFFIVSVFLNLQSLIVQESILNLNQLQVKNKDPQTLDANLVIFDRSRLASSNWLCRAHL
jgi:hypothetical protein